MLVFCLWSLLATSVVSVCAQSRIVGGEISVQNERPFQVSKSGLRVQLEKYVTSFHLASNTYPKIGTNFSTNTYKHVHAITAIVGVGFGVALYSRVGTTGELGFCGGALINQEWVLTAAHCCFHNNEEVNNVQAILGAFSLYAQYENGRRVVNVAETIVHPDYDPDSFANDIALMRLANVVQFTDTIQPIRLPYRSILSFNFAGVGAIVSGWGIAAEGVTFVSPTLRQKLMTVITDPLCSISYFNQLPDTTICTFYGTSGTCKGDNGGPLTMFYNATEEDVLIGVASFVSASGCNDDLPSVFTRVQRYIDWISQVTGIILL